MINTNLKQIQKNLRSKLKKAKQGKKLLDRIYASNSLKPEDICVVIPKGDDECEYYALLYFNQYKATCAPGLKHIIITDDAAVSTSYTLFTDQILECIRLSNEEMLLLLEWYKLVCNDTIVWCSLLTPEARTGLECVGFSDITIEKIVIRSIYHLKDFHEEKPPICEGQEVTPEILFKGCKS